ncbi:TPA: histidine phosphatase family protein [Neisseria weaveri]
MSLEVYLVRHGKTVFNTVGRLQGWSDSPLTQEGRAVAENLGLALAERNITFDAAFSSISPRAVDTARLILHAAGMSGLEVGTIADLREYCFGGFEGEYVQTVHQAVARHRGLSDADTWLQVFRSAETHLLAESVSELDFLDLAETEAQFVGRLRRGMRELVCRAPGQGRILMVSHGMAITSILKSIDKDSIPYQSVPNASVSRLVFEGEVWRIESVGEMLS